MFEGSVPLDNFISAHLLLLIEEQLACSPDNMGRIAVVEQFLLSRLFNIKPDRLISAAIQKIQSSKGLIKITELANSLYISQDAFEKRFRKAAGTSPKQFSSIVRMKALIGQKQHHQNFSDAAFEAGYFDQPHFNKDFKLFTGQTPSDFFKSPPRW